MILVKPSIKFEDMNSMGIKLIELAARNCYKSEDKIGEGTAEKMVRKLLDQDPPHDPMVEFGWMCYRVICDRGVSHEIVRHRLYSFGQESTRYCNYKGGVTFIIPSWIDIPGRLLDVEVVFDGDIGVLGIADKEKKTIDTGYVGDCFIWLRHMQRSEHAYQALIRKEWSPQQARAVLPNALKTEIVMGANIREWRRFFKMRCSLKAHPQMQEVAYMLLEDAQKRVPVVFDEFPGKPPIYLISRSKWL